MHKGEEIGVENTENSGPNSEVWVDQTLGGGFGA
jgi:hypothetical protein